MSRVLQKQFAFFGEVASMLLHGVISILRATVPETYSRVRLQVADVLALTRGRL